MVILLLFNQVSIRLNDCLKIKTQKIGFILIQNTFDTYYLRIIFLSSVWNVTRSHPSSVRLRGSIYWTEECNNCRMSYISNCDISYIFFSSTFIDNSLNNLWVSFLSWCKHCTYTTNDNR